MALDLCFSVFAVVVLFFLDVLWCSSGVSNGAESAGSLAVFLVAFPSFLKDLG